MMVRHYVHLRGTRLLSICLLVFAISAVAVAASAQIQSSIPDYIRQNILSWAQGDADDQRLVANIQFMIETDMITVPQVALLEIENQALRDQIAEHEATIQSLTNATDALTISVHTNKEQYGRGDNIMIFGLVSYLVEDHEVGIVISNSAGRVLAIAKIPPNSDGSYGFLASDPVFRELGEYDIHVYYGGRAYSSASYSYNPGELRS